MKAYKLIAKDKYGKFWSCYGFYNGIFKHEFHVAKTQYYKTKISKRKDNCGPLAVFKTLEDAKNFYWTNRDAMIACVKLNTIVEFQIWKIDVIQKYDSRPNYRYLWNYYKNKKYRYTASNNVIICNSIMFDKVYVNFINK